MTETIDAVGNPSFESVDLAGRPSISIDAAGVERQDFYDRDGNLTGVLDPLVIAPNPPKWLSRTLYDGDGNVTETIDANGQASYTNYDADGRVTGTMDAAGHTTQTQYDFAGQVTGSVDGDGNLTKYTYDRDGHVTKTIDGLLRTSLQKYDLLGNLTQTVDVYGKTTSMSYDKDGRVTATTDPLGNVNKTLYDLMGRVTGAVDGMNVTTSSWYDALGRVTETIDANGVPSYNYYDADVNVTKTVDGNNNATYTSYDSLGNVTAVLDGDNFTTRTLYDIDGRVTETIDGANRPSYTYYDEEGNVSGTADGFSRVTSDLLDGSGQVTETLDSQGHMLSKTLYDGDGNVTETIDGDGNPSYTYFDGNGNVSGTMDAFGHTTRTLYDGVGRVTGTIDDRGTLAQTIYDDVHNTKITTDGDNKTSYTYFDFDGRVTGTLDAAGNTTSTAYDADGRVAGTVDGKGGLTQTFYDNNGNVVLTIDPLGNHISSSYDNDNREISTTNALNRTTTYLRDALGNVTETVDPLTAGLSQSLYNGDGQVTETIDAATVPSYTYYDADGQVTGTTDADGHLTKKQYDLDGNLTGIVDPDSNLTAYTYDAAGNQLTMTDAFGHTATTSYNADGQVTMTVDRNGRTDTMGYDANGNKTSETWYDPNHNVVNQLTWTYDGDNNLLTASSNSGTYTYTYNDDGQVATETEPNGLSLAYGYDQDGNKNLIQDSQGGTTSSTYDDNGNLISRSFSGNGVTLRFDQSWTLDGQLGAVQRYSDLAGTQLIGSSLYTYDNDGRLTHLQYSNGSGTVIYDEVYHYNGDNRLTEKDINSVPTYYNYDAAGQLTVAGASSYSYDNNGNPTPNGTSIGTNNQLLFDGTYTYTYDAAGNLATKTTGSGTTAQVWTYSYDNANHLTEVRENLGGTLTYQIVYVYDVFDNRIEQDEWTAPTGTVVTRYGFDDQQNAWIDLNSSNSLVNRYIRPDGQNALAARVSGSGAAAWYGTDYEGSVAFMTDNTGAAQDSINYDAWGNITSEANANVRGNYAYTGGTIDTATGLLHLGGRDLSLVTHIWIEQDPIGFDAGQSNLVQYVGNGPTNGTDPTGTRLFVQAGPLSGGLNNEYVQWLRNEPSNIGAAGFEGLGMKSAGSSIGLDSEYAQITDGNVAEIEKGIALANSRGWTQDVERLKAMLPGSKDLYVRWEASLTGQYTLPGQSGKWTIENSTTPFQTTQRFLIELEKAGEAYEAAFDSVKKKYTDKIRPRITRPDVPKWLSPRIDVAVDQVHAIVTSYTSLVEAARANETIQNGSGLETLKTKATILGLSADAGINHLANVMGMFEAINQIQEQDSGHVFNTHRSAAYQLMDKLVEAISHVCVDDIKPLYQHYSTWTDISKPTKSLEGAQGQSTALQNLLWKHSTLVSGIDKSMAVYGLLALVRSAPSLVNAVKNLRNAPALARLFEQGGAGVARLQLAGSGSYGGFDVILGQGIARVAALADVIGLLAIEAIPAVAVAGVGTRLLLSATPPNGQMGDAPKYAASLGKAASNDYKATFFKANPTLEGEVVVHHAIPQKVLTQYPGVITEAELHSLENLRGIPKAVNSKVHLSDIAKEWNEFYRTHQTATKAQLLQKATEIDLKFGTQFTPPVGG